MKRALSWCVLCGLVALALASCNQNNYYNTTSQIIAGNFRAFVSNPLYPTATGAGAPAIQVMDAARDLLSVSIISLNSLSDSMSSAGMMAVSPKKDRTLVYSPPDNKLGVVSNSGESLSKAIALPGSTESFFFADNNTVFVAIPNAPMTGLPAGAVLRIDLASSTTTATLPIAGAHYLVPSPNKNQILVFSDNSDAATLITPSLIDVSSSTSTQVCSSTQTAVCTIPVTLDRPVSAVYNTSGTTAYVMNCGAECGGAGIGSCSTFTLCTSVSVLDMTQNPPAVVNSVGVPAATVGLLQGNSLYVAGTPKLSSDNDCTSFTPTTAATTCGRLTVINTGSLTTTSVAITDGYHNRMQISLNSQLFIGSRSCTDINQPILPSAGTEVRGCLTIANVTSGSLAASGIIAPPDNGDVTGLEPITNRNVVYVCQGGKLRIYDTTTDKLETNPQQPNIIGQAVDVKEADF